MFGAFELFLYLCIMKYPKYNQHKKRVVEYIRLSNILKIKKQGGKILMLTYIKSK